MILMAGEAFSDVFQGIAQKHWRMDIVGVSFLLRGVLLIVSFTVLYIVSGLTVAVLCSSVLTLLVIWFFDVNKVKKLESIRLEINKIDISRLLRTCLPLMILNMLQISFVSASRIALESATDLNALGIYNSATIPAAVLFQAAGFIFIPIINVLAESFSSGNYKRFNRQIMLVCGIICVLIAAGIALSVIIGADLLSLLFEDSIYRYAYLLTEAFIATGFASLMWFMIIVLTITRKLMLILIGCSIGFLCCISSAPWFLSRFEMSGANYMQMLGLAVSVVFLLTAHVINMRKLRRAAIQGEVL